MEDPQKLIELDYSITSPEIIEVLIEDISEPSVFEEIAKANVKRPEVMKLLLEHPDTPDDVKQFIRDALSVPSVPGREMVKVEKKAVSKETKAETLTQKIQRLNVSARVQLAIKGGREIRGILARDPNKQVMLAVLDNGKITESEIEMISKSRSAIEDVLRKIANNKEWIKKYPILLALVTNPKTPAGIVVSHLTAIKTKDLKGIETNKNLAEAIRSAAKKLMMWKKPR